jgi:transposase
MYELIHHENQQTNSRFSSSIDDAINQENQVRLIDLTVLHYLIWIRFVKRRDLLHPSDLLKLFIDGYLNRMCSSRTLEKDGRNIELMWQGGFLRSNYLPILERDQKPFLGFHYHGKTSLT